MPRGLLHETCGKWRDRRPWRQMLRPLWVSTTPPAPGAPSVRGFHTPPHSTHCGTSTMVSNAMAARYLTGAARSRRATKHRATRARTVRLPAPKQSASSQRPPGRNRDWPSTRAPVLERSTTMTSLPGWIRARGGRCPSLNATRGARRLSARIDTPGSRRGIARQQCGPASRAQDHERVGTMTSPSEVERP